MAGSVLSVVADVLNEHDATAARALLAEAMMAASDTAMATRVDVRRDRPDAGLRIHGHGFRPAVEELPGAQEIRDHPLYRYRVQTGDARPTRLEDVMRLGWQLREPTRHLIEALQITVHQVAFPVASGGEYAGWSLLSPEPISRLQLRALVDHARLLRGLDSHVELLAHAHALAPAADDGVLTPRERAVLHLMLAGCTAAAIGSRLAVSPRTVQKHQENIYRKLGVGDRLSAVLVAQRMGLLPGPPTGEETRVTGQRDGP